MTDIRAPKTCGLFKPGHQPHFVQWLQTTKDKIDLPSSGEFIEAREDGTIVIEVDDKELHLWNHQPERIAEAVAVGGSAIGYQPYWGLLWVPSRDGRYAFCVAPSLDDHVQCPLQPPVGSPAEMLESAGGFTISANDPWRSHL